MLYPPPLVIQFLVLKESILEEILAISCNLFGEMMGNVLKYCKLVMTIHVSNFRLPKLLLTLEHGVHPRSSKAGIYGCLTRNYGNSSAWENADD